MWEEQRRVTTSYINYFYIVFPEAHPTILTYISWSPLGASKEILYLCSFPHRIKLRSIIKEEEAVENYVFLLYLHVLQEWLYGIFLIFGVQYLHMDIHTKI